MADIKVSALDAADDIDPEDLFLVIKPASPNNLMTHATGEQLRDFCGGGSFLSANTARVDPSGDNGTGTIGDLAKPFLTVQGALDEIIATGHALDHVIIYFGSNELTEDITIAEPIRVHFVGVSGQSTALAFNSLVQTGNSESASKLDFTNCSAGNITSDGSIALDVEDVYLSDVTSTDGPVSLQADFGGSEVGDVTATDTIVIYGFNQVGTLSAPGSQISIFACRSVSANSGDGTYIGLPTINSAGSAVFATGSLIQTVTDAGVLTLKDSRVVGTNNATSTVYADVLLAPRDGLQLFDGSHVLSLDAGTRQLYASDGTTEILDWSDPTGITVFNGSILFAVDGSANFSGEIYADFLHNNSGDGNANIDLLNRKLYASDGTTVVLDYSSNGGSLTLDASGFNGNLTTSDNTLQEVAQKVDDLVIGASGAPTGATYITQTHDATLSAEQALGDLASGLMKSATTTGVVSTVAAPAGAVVGTSDTQTLTNKTYDQAGTNPQLKLASNSVLGTPVTGGIEYDSTNYYGTVGGPTRQTFATSANTLTMTGKTLTTPNINGGTFDKSGTTPQLKLSSNTVLATPVAGGIEYDTDNFYGTTATSGAVRRTFATLDQTQTLTNKTLGATTFTGAQTNSTAGAASVPAEILTGTWLTGGTGTTNFPHLLLQATGTTASTTWNTAGTAIGANAVTGFTGNLIDLQLAGASKVKVSSAGLITSTGGLTIGSSGQFTVDNAGILVSSGNVAFTGSFVRSASIFRLGATATNSSLEVFRDAVNGITMRAADATATWNDPSTANSGTVANRYLFGIAAPTLTATNTSVTDTVASTVYIGGAPTASTNTTIGTPYALNVAGGVTNLAGPVVVSQGYTVATLPSTAATGKVTGARAYVTDATAPTYLGALTGGGAVVCPVFYNGTAWVSA